MLQYMPGATVIGIASKDGVVLASERRYAYGNYVVSKNVKKVFKVTETVGAACAGMVGDMQVLVKNIQSLIRLREMETGKKSKPNSVAKLMSVLMFENRMYPLLTQVVVGGVSEKPEIYVLDPLGSVLPDKYVAIGSGEEIAIGVIENDYRDDISSEEAVDLAVRAIKSAVKRDAASGDGVDILVIKKDGSELKSINF
ncbi:MAG: archaeal proteasome endopeptidase complex subunit beta [Thaumarchaeota archaeon]|nr:archaeal proteasome endopeptidase complex subunit beta [Nitrososphaerota archaeon]